MWVTWQALDRVEAEAKAGGAAPAGASKREQRDALVRVQREVKDERTKLQKEKVRTPTPPGTH